MVVVKEPQIKVPETAVRSPKKTIIVVTSDKGGCGKSTVSRTIADMVVRRNLPTLSFDCDKRNAQLHRYYHQAFSSTFNSDLGVTRLDLSAKGGADKLINSFDSEETQIILIDLPAGGGELFEHLEKEVKLFDLLDEIECQMTMVSVLSRVKDSVMSLRTLIDYCGDRVNHVVVKNGYWGTPEKFSRFDNSKTKGLVLQKGGIIVNFPELYDDTYDLLDDKDMTFSDAIKPASGLMLADRRRVKVFLDEAETELLKAAQFLGLD